MNPLCYQLLTGNLVSPESWNPVQAYFYNGLSVPVSISAVVGNADQYGSSGTDPLPLVQPNSSPLQITVDPSWYYAITVPSTGGLIDVVQFSSSRSTILAPLSLTKPNDLGPIPLPTASKPPITPQPPTVVPNSTMIVPPDSPRVLVGCGVAPNGNYITREQYWERQSDSICMAGHETRTVSFTTTQGKQQTSSDTTTVSASLSTSISGGWGPVSASISASLSASRSSFQQVTVTEETTSYVSHTITNPHEVPVMYLRWQLTDVITVFQGPHGPAGSPPVGTPLSSVIMAESPIVVTGPYWTTEPPKPGADGNIPAGLLVYR
jgi:hypothetical protein